MATLVVRLPVVFSASAITVGTRLSAPDREVLELALIVAASGNALVAVIQQHADLASIGLPLYTGGLQPTGMLGNPVFLGALLAGALALVAPRLARSWWWAAVVVLLGLGLGVDAERLPFILAVVVVAVEIAMAVIVARHAGGARGASATGRAVAPMVVFGALAIGAIVVGSLTAGSDSAQVPTSVSTSSTSAAPAAHSTPASQSGVIKHFQTSTSYETFGERVDIWRAAWHAFVDRPLVGYGPNQFRAATTPDYPTTLADDFQTQVYSNDLYLDAHDLVIELAVTVGIVGLALFSVWLVLSVRRRRGALVLFALVLLASELAEPLNVVITPLALLALGAAACAPRAGPVEQGMSADAEVDGAKASDGAETPIGDGAGFWARWSRGPRSLNVTSLVLGALAAVLGLLLVVGDVALTEGIESPPASAAAHDDASRAEALLSAWPDSAALWGGIDANTVVNALPQAVGWYQAAVNRDRTNPLYLELLGASELSTGHEQAGRSAAERAVAVQPWNASALDLLGAVYQSEGRTAAARRLYRESLSYLPDQPLIEEFLSGQCLPALPGSFEYQPMALGCARPGG